MSSRLGYKLAILPGLSEFQFETVSKTKKHTQEAGRLVDLCEFKANLVYIMSYRPVRDT